MSENVRTLGARRTTTTHLLVLPRDLLGHLHVAELVHVVQPRLCVLRPELVEPLAKLAIELVLNLFEARGLAFIAQRVGCLHEALRALLRGLVDGAQLIIQRFAIRRQQRLQSTSTLRHRGLVPRPEAHDSLLHRVPLHRRRRAHLPPRHHVHLPLLKDV